MCALSPRFKPTSRSSNGGGKRLAPHLDHPALRCRSGERPPVDDPRVGELDQIALLHGAIERYGPSARGIAQTLELASIASSPSVTSRRADRFVVAAMPHLGLDLDGRRVAEAFAGRTSSATISGRATAFSWRSSSACTYECWISSPMTSLSTWLP